MYCDPNGNLPILGFYVAKKAVDYGLVIAGLLITAYFASEIVPNQSTTTIVDIPRITVDPIQILKDLLTGVKVNDRDKELALSTDAIAEEAEREKAEQKITPYREAHLTGGNVIIGRYITQSEAIKRVVGGLDVMCDDSSAAYDLVWRFGLDELIYEIDKGKENVYGYYYHFHTSANNPSHIWHLGAGNPMYIERYHR